MLFVVRDHARAGCQPYVAALVDQRLLLQCEYLIAQESNFSLTRPGKGPTCDPQ
jgi:hypothetical protein